MLDMRNDADLRTFGLTAAYFLSLMVFYRGFYTNHLAVQLVLFSTTCYLSFVGAVAVHNTIHCPVFYSKINNKIFQVILSLTYGHPVSAYVPGHNLSHHQNTQTARDVMRTTKMRYKWHFLNGLLFFPIIGLGMLKNDAEYFSAQRSLKRPIYRQFCLEKVIVNTYYAIFAITDFYRFIICLIIPHLFAKCCIISLNMLQHDGCDQDDEYNHSRNFTDPMLNWFCYNNGYHGIHHLHPGWHWSQNKEKHDKLIKPHLHPNLEQKSILGYMFRTFIYPGVRIDYLGNKLDLPAEVPDEPWFYDSNETYSSKGDVF